MRLMLLVSLFVLAPVGEAVAQGLLFEAVTVVPMDRAVALEAQDVLVVGERIVAMGAHGTLDVPAGTERIDGRGRFLVPGLCDLHVHIEYRAELELYLMHGVTTVRNMWGGPDLLALRDRISAGELPGPRIFTTGPIVDGPDPRWPGSPVVDTPRAAELEVRRQVEAGYDAIKVYDGIDAHAYQALARAAEDCGLPVVGHVPHAVGLEGVLQARQESVEHLGGWVLVPDERIAEVAKRCAGSVTWTCPTLVVHELPWSALRDLDEAWLRPEIALVPASIRARWDPATDRRFGGITRLDDELWNHQLRRMQRLRRIVRELRDAGAPLIVGTDSPNPFVVPGYAVHQELQALVAAGLSPFEALAAATSRAAEFLRRDQEVGVVAAGRRADLLLLRANPLEDIRATMTIQGVVLGGCWFDAAELARRRVEWLRMVDVDDVWFGEDGDADWLTFDVRWNRTAIGAERIRREGGDLIGQSVYREGFVERRVAHELRGFARGRRLRIDYDEGEARGWVAVTHRGDTLLLDGSWIDGETLAGRLPGSSDVQIAAGLLEHLMLAADRIGVLGRDERCELELRTPEVGEVFELSSTRLELTRDGDATRLLRREQVPVRVYRLRLTTGDWRTRGTLTTAADGLPVTIELIFPQGHKVFRRR